MAAVLISSGAGASFVKLEMADQLVGLLCPGPLVTWTSRNPKGIQYLLSKIMHPMNQQGLNHQYQGALAVWTSEPMRQTVQKQLGAHIPIFMLGDTLAAALLDCCIALQLVMYAKNGALSRAGRKNLSTRCGGQYHERP